MNRTPLNLILSDSKLFKTDPTITHFFKAFALIFFFLIACNISAQNYPKTNQPWTLLATEIASIEISYMVIKCDSNGDDLLYIKVFNEKPVTDSVDFDVTIYKQDNTDSTTKNIKLQMKVAQMAYPQCGSSLFNNLIISLPSGYDPKKIKASVKFN